MLSASHWLLAQTRFCGCTHLPLSPNSTMSTGQGDIPISSTGCTCFQHPPYSQHLWAWWHFSNHLVDIILEWIQLSQHPLIHSTCGHDDILVITPVLSILSVNNIRRIHTCRSRWYITKPTNQPISNSGQSYQHFTLHSIQRKGINLSVIPQTMGK